MVTNNGDALPQRLRCAFEDPMDMNRATTDAHYLAWAERQEHRAHVAMAFLAPKDKTRATLNLMRACRAAGLSKDGICKPAKWAASYDTEDEPLLMVALYERTTGCKVVDPVMGRWIVAPPGSRRMPPSREALLGSHPTARPQPPVAGARGGNAPDRALAGAPNAQRAAFKRWLNPRTLRPDTEASAAGVWHVGAIMATMAVHAVAKAQAQRLR